MTHMTNRMTMVAAGVALLVAGIGAGYWWANRSTDHDMASATVSPMEGRDERKVLYWYDPMVPDQHFDKPGKSPFMDMQLVPKFGPAAAADCQASEVMSEAMEGTP